MAACYDIDDVLLSGNSVEDYPIPCLMPSNSTDAVIANQFDNCNIVSTINKIVNSKPRSMSAGKPRLSGRNLVEDVYTRLGVERPIDDKSGASPESPTRGRSPGLATAADQRRARSLSRGRVRNRWPPSDRKKDTNTDIPQNAEDGPTSPTSLKDKNLENDAIISPLSLSLSPNAQRSYKSTAANVYLNSRTELSSMTMEQSLNSFKGIPMSPSLEWKDEKKQSDSFSENDNDLSSPISVKNRRLAFGRPVETKKKVSPAITAAPRFSVDKQYAAQFATRDHPPKINIYETEKNHSSLDDPQNEDSAEDIVYGPKPIERRKLSKQKDSLKETACSSKLSLSPPAAKSNIANVFLAAIQAPTVASPPSTKRHLSPSLSGRHSFAPVAEVVSKYEEDQSITGAESLSIYSNNSEDNGYSNMSGQQQQRVLPRSKSWNRVSAYISQTTSTKNQPITTVTTTSSSSTLPVSSPTRMDTSMIERIVEERVRVRVADMERQMLNHLQTFMNRIDERMENHMRRLERSLEQQALLVVSMQDDPSVSCARPKEEEVV